MHYWRHTTTAMFSVVVYSTGKSKNTIAAEKTTYGRKQLPGPKLVPTLLLACRRETLLLLEYVQRYSTHLLLVACCFFPNVSTVAYSFSSPVAWWCVLGEGRIGV